MAHPLAADSQNLRHPNIVLLMGTVVKPPRLCIISELCIRGSLHEILHDPRTKGRSLPWRLRLTMAQDAARGCAFLHSHDPCIVHLDLKSANLVVDKNMTLKVADFGLACEWWRRARRCSDFSHTRLPFCPRNEWCSFSSWRPHSREFELQLWQRRKSISILRGTLASERPSGRHPRC
eukprot:SAG11_NODE_558_length_8540_cov_3.877147_3_plen_178_part_00